MGTDASKMVTRGERTEDYPGAVLKADLSFTLETAPMSSRKLCKTVALRAGLKQPTQTIQTQLRLRQTEVCPHPGEDRLWCTH